MKKRKEKWTEHIRTMQPTKILQEIKLRELDEQEKALSEWRKKHSK